MRRKERSLTVKTSLEFNNRGEITMGDVKVRKATHQGSKHRQLGFNNQDGVLLEPFCIPAFGKRYTVGIVCDGCTGLPGFSKTEVGASLLPVFVYGRCQEFLCSGLPLSQIPTALFQSCTEFLRDLAQKVVPSNLYWGYPEELLPALTKLKTGRLDWDVATRFRVDYLSATLLGFVADEAEIVIFSAGDGIILVNDEIDVIDQNNKPEYPASSINNPGKGFSVRIFNRNDIRRVAVCSDGLTELMKDPEFVEQMFSAHPGLFGLQVLLNNTYNERDYLMEDDCTAITFEMGGVSCTE